MNAKPELLTVASAVTVQGPQGHTAIQPEPTADTQTAKEQKTLRRRTAMTRVAASIRAGTPVPSSSMRELELVFKVPSDSTKGSPDEVEAVAKLQEELRQFADLGDVKEVTVAKGEFRLAFQLRGISTLTDDQLVSLAFLRLMPTIEASTVLQDGFCGDQPYWEVVKYGDFVADEGTFKTQTSEVASAIP